MTRPLPLPPLSTYSNDIQISAIAAADLAVKDGKDSALHFARAIAAERERCAGVVDREAAECARAGAWGDYAKPLAVLAARIRKGD